MPSMLVRKWHIAPILQSWTGQPPLIRQVMKTSTHFLLTNSNKHYTIKMAVKGSQTNMLTPGKTVFIEHNLLSVNKSNSLLIAYPSVSLGLQQEHLLSEINVQ